MSEWKEAINKLIEGIKNEPLLAFVVLIVIVLALLGAQILPEFRLLVYFVVLFVVIVYAARLLGFSKKEPTERMENPVLPRPQPAPRVEIAQPVLAPVSVEDARAKYLDAVVADTLPARLVGVDPSAADPSRATLTLADLYIALDTTTMIEIEENKMKKKEKAAEFLEREKKEPLTALKALVQTNQRRMVLTGLPGSGKSTFVRYLALRLAQTLRDPSLDLNKHLPEWRGQPLLPLIIPLGRFAESMPVSTKTGNARQIEDFVEKILEADSRAVDFAPHALAALKQSGGVVLFDGLDEVADLKMRPVVKQAVEDFANQYGRNSATRFLVTCRTFSYTDPSWQLSGWVRHELAPLTQDKIEYFVRIWHDQHASLDPARRESYERKRDRMLGALRPDDRRRLAEIADNPLILTVMAVVHTHYDELPDTRAQVYERCIDLLLVRWEMERRISGKPSKKSLLDALDVPRGKLDDALYEIAFKAHEGRQSLGDRRTASVTEDLLWGVLGANLQDPQKVQTFLDYCEGANGLLMLQGQSALPDAPAGAPPRHVYAFPHLSFEEYLAGRFLNARPNLGKRVRELLDTSSDRWREVVMLLGEHVCFAQGEFERMDRVLAELASAVPSRTDKDWRALWMAGDLLVLYNRRFKDLSPHREGVVQGLVRLVEIGALPPPERCAAANALAELGDPREGVGIQDGLPDLVWCEIPAGDFTMGDNEEYGGGGSFPYTQITRPFYIARYPITNAQFDAFLNDSDGFQNKKWWNGLARCDNTAKPPKQGGVYDLPNHPVVNVTWYQSVAFARWLNEQFRISDCGFQIYDPATNAIRPDPNLKLAIANRKLEIRLPSEAEWEKAARGNDGQKFPWGNDPADPNRVNYADTGIGATSAVGCFPDGHSPYDVLDMSGNVWEWCTTQWVESYKEYNKRENFNLEGESPRVLRGGSWFYESDFVRAAFRGRYVPVYRNGDDGFRVVVRPFDSAL